MKNVVVLLVALLWTGTSLSAQEKGSTPLNQLTNHQSTNHQTRAVVIGISDYQDPDIPDLRFAHKDAEAFANFLYSPAGGSLDDDNLKVLINENATAGRVAEAFDALVEQAKENDRVIIYFSGHGDVERKTVSQPGFLLCWDAPSRVYMGGGTYSLAFLQEIVTTLSTQNMARVTVITDACHAGLLSGSQIGGAQLTAASMAKQYANEVKILSCQPNEFSLEGEQWGGGRGCFSYHLVDGLLGLADRNEDDLVTVGELDRYLEDHVTAEAAPQSQVPMLLGNKTERLTRVNAQILADLQKSKSGQLAVFAPVEGRGFEDEVLAKVDSSVREQYLAFKRAVREKRFFEPAGNNAEEFYARLFQNDSLAPLRGFMKRNYAAALQDDAQQVLNAWLKTEQGQVLSADVANKAGRLPTRLFTDKVRAFPRCLDRAAELLGQQHYMYTSLQARKCFFEGYLLANSNRNPDKELGERALTLFRQSLQWQANQPQVYWQMSSVFGYNLLQPDSMEHYTRRAMEVHPFWVLPCFKAAFLFSVRFKQFHRAKPYLEQASRIDSNSARVSHYWGMYNFAQKRYAEAEQQITKAVSMDTADADAWISLGALYHITRRYAEAEQAYTKAISLDSTDSVFWRGLGAIYSHTRRYAEAEPAYKKAISLDSTNARAWGDLGVLYFNTSRYAEMEPVLKKAVSLDSLDFDVWNSLGTFYHISRRYAEAEFAYKKATLLDSTDVHAWNNLGKMYYDTRHYTEAEQALKKAAFIDSTFVASWINLGALYHMTLRYSEAEQVLKKSISLDSTSFHSWNNLGISYMNSERYAEAEQVFKKSITIDSTNAIGWSNLGFVLLQTRQYAKAEPVLQKSIAINATFANPHKHLGMVYFKNNRLDEARQSFLKAIALNPNYAPALLGMAYLSVESLAKADSSSVNLLMDEAISYVEQAIGKGSTFEQLEQDEDLAPLRERREQWKALMKKYFPDQVKD